MVCLFSRRVGDTSHTEEKQDMTKNMHHVHDEGRGNKSKYIMQAGPTHQKHYT